VIVESIRPGVRGFQKRYYWRDLETGIDRYDFSQIRRDLDLMARHGMQLVILVEDKSFRNENPLPDYLGAQNRLPNRADGYTARRWDGYVIERMRSLTAAIGREFDRHPNFEGLAFQESAPSLSPGVLESSDYTAEKYAKALITILTDAARNLPNSRIFWYMNFLPGKQSLIADIAAAIAPYGVVMGGPDVLPDSPPLTSRVYPYYRRFQGKLPLFAGIQFSSYAHEHGDRSRPTRYWTMDELFDFAVEELHANYIFWTRKPRPDPADSYDWTDALPVIETNSEFNPQPQ
jgi:hypothetical protein